MREPARQFANRQAMAGRQGRAADKAFFAVFQVEPVNGPTRRVGAVQHPDFLAEPGADLTEVVQRSDVGIDATADILQIKQNNVEIGEHGICWFPVLSIKTDDRDTVHGIQVVIGLDHIVLFVTAHTVLWAKSCHYRATDAD